MEVILLEKVTNLGKLGDMVKVRAGFGRNYLIPRGKAVPATAENRAQFEQRRAELEKAEADALGAAQARRESLHEKVVTIAAHAGDEGKLFGSVGTSDIAEAVTKEGIVVDKSEVRLPNGSLRTTGEHEVEIHLHPDVDATIIVNVIGE